MATMQRSRNSRSIRLFSEGRDAIGDTATLAADTYSAAIPGADRDGTATIHLIWGAGITATVTVEATLVQAPELASSADWVNITANCTIMGTALAIAGAAGNTIINLPSANFEFYRVFVDFGSGSGTMRGYARTNGDS